MKSTSQAGNVIAITNQKGGVGKTTTATNLAQGLTLLGHKVLLIDLDQQGNATRGFGIQLETVTTSIAELIRDRELPDTAAIYKGPGLDLIPATPLLARVEREMAGMTNSELRIAARLRGLRERYSFIILDTPPGNGPLMRSALNAADRLIVPVDSGFYAMIGIKELLAEIEEVRASFNPQLEILGFLLTQVDQTNLSDEISTALMESFKEQVFEARIRRSVRIKEAPLFGKTIFHHAPHCSGADDYLRLTQEVVDKLTRSRESVRPQLRVIAEMGTMMNQGGVQ